MNRRQMLAGTAISMAGIAGLTHRVSAGGWATIELTKPVTSAVAGTPVDFEFQVFQHGVSPIEELDATVVATHADTGTKLEVSATESSPGVYLAEMTFDQPGRWKLRASASFNGTSASFPTVMVTGKSTSSTDGTPAADGPVVVEIINTSFVPSALDILAGTTVTFVNRDPIKHEVAFRETSVDDSGIMESNAEYEVTFAMPGEYLYACGPHPGMTGTITVK